MGSDFIDIRMGIKTLPSEQFKVMRELRTRLKERFDDEGIETSSPQRTMWIGDSTGEIKTQSSVSEGDEHL
jgi:small conductance mechanosensitive channel